MHLKIKLDEYDLIIIYSTLGHIYVLPSCQ